MADTASVDDSAYVGPTAKVYGKAQVMGKAHVSDNAKVMGNAMVYGNARVFSTAECSRTPIVLSSPEFDITVTDDLILVTRDQGRYSNTDVSKLPIPLPYQNLVREVFLGAPKPPVKTSWERL